MATALAHITPGVIAHSLFDP